jgi:hypothetical protein
MQNCARALDLLDEMLKLTKEANGHGEQGFVGCSTEGGRLVVGARCADPGDHCTVQGPMCPGGGTPKLSFHSHSTAPTLVEALSDGNPFVGDAAKVALLPSVKDIVADGELGVDIGCVGGPLNDGTSLLWCFWRGEAAPSKDKVQDFQERVKSMLLMHPAVELSPRERLMSFLDEYVTKISAPCMELRLPLAQAQVHPEFHQAVDCPMCVGAVA